MAMSISTEIVVQVTVNSHLLYLLRHPSQQPSSLRILLQLQLQGFMSKRGLGALTPQKIADCPTKSLEKKLGRVEPCFMTRTYLFQQRYKTSLNTDPVISDTARGVVRGATGVPVVMSPPPPTNLPTQLNLPTNCEFNTRDSTAELHRRRVLNSQLVHDRFGRKIEN